MLLRCPTGLRSPTISKVFGADWPAGSVLHRCTRRLVAAPDRDRLGGSVVLLRIRGQFKIRFRKECRFEPDHPHQHLIRCLTLVVGIAMGTVVEAVTVLARAQCCSAAEMVAKRRRTTKTR